MSVKQTIILDDGFLLSSSLKQMLNRKPNRIKKIPFYYLLFYKVILCAYISDRKPEILL